MILLFIGLTIGVLVLSFVMFGLLARNWNWWPLLAQLELEHQNVLMRAVLLVKD